MLLLVLVWLLLRSRHRMVALSLLRLLRCSQECLLLLPQRGSAQLQPRQFCHGRVRKVLSTSCCRWQPAGLLLVVVLRRRHVLLLHLAR